MEFVIRISGLIATVFGCIVIYFWREHKFAEFFGEYTDSIGFFMYPGQILLGILCALTIYWTWIPSKYRTGLFVIGGLIGFLFARKLWLVSGFCFFLAGVLDLVVKKKKGGSNRVTPQK